MKKAAIVILNWNGRKLLEQFLPPLVEYSGRPDVDIVVADNASSDNSVEFLLSAYPQIRLIRLNDNYGYAGGYNRALAEVEAEYFVLLNSDVEVTPNWLAPLLNCLDNTPDVAAVQPKLLSYSNKDCFEYAGAAGGFIDKYGYPFCRGRVFGQIEKDNGQYDEPADIFWASGACMVIRQKDFGAAGGFDAGFFAHMEEIDLCWRLHARGRRVVCLPQSTVYHLGGATLTAESPQKTFLNFRNNLLMLYKNLPEKDLKKTLRLRCLLDYLAALQLALAGKPKNARAVFAARCAYRKLCPDYRLIRDENLANTQTPVVKTVYPASLLYAFYLKGRKTYTEIMR
ncbi:MAG: glycosyltransferase family 2 protein [Prevotella sp.]|jgi:GT2 family glycosyltransferase|nr:glycosyltransferase family 2 protein [Prevotella sp.]